MFMSSLAAFAANVLMILMLKMPTRLAVPTAIGGALVLPLLAVDTKRVVRCRPASLYSCPRHPCLPP